MIRPTPIGWMLIACLVFWSMVVMLVPRGDDKMIGKHDVAEWIDKWDQRRLELKRQYVERGMPETDADERALAETRREIRENPPFQPPPK